MRARRRPIEDRPAIYIRNDGARQRRAFELRGHAFGGHGFGRTVCQRILQKFRTFGREPTKHDTVLRVGLILLVSDIVARAETGPEALCQ